MSPDLVWKQNYKRQMTLPVRFNWSFGIENASFLVSISAHLIVIILIFYFGSRYNPLPRSFETSVFFERSQKTDSHELDSLTLTGVRRSDQQLGLSKIDLGTYDTNRKITDVEDPGVTPSLKKYITKPSEIKNYKTDPDIQGFLKGDHKVNSVTMPDTLKQRDKQPTATAEARKGLIDIDKEEDQLDGIDLNVPSETDDTRKPADADPLISNRKASDLWQKKMELGEYRRILARLITANWTVPPVSISDFQIILEATIDRRGNLVKTQIIESSGLAGLDAAAERAVRVSQPFPEFPPSFDPELKHFVASFRFSPDRVGN